jgi:DNA polymerase sigma
VCNSAAVFNSAAVGALTSVDARFPALVALVLRWARARQINTAALGSFNSFSLTLMVLGGSFTNFLSVRPPVRPFSVRPACRWFLGRLLSRAHGA